MAIQAYQPGADEEKDKQEDVGALPQTSSAGAPSGGGAPVGQAAQSGPATSGPSSSGQFTDVGKFLEANKQAAGGFAKAAGKGIRDQLSESQAAIDTKASEYQKGIEGARSNLADYQGKSASQLNLEGARNVLQGGSKVLSPDQIALNEIAGLEKAGQMADMTKSYSGSKAYLGETMTPQVKDYSQGERGLDAVFLSRDKAAREAMSNLGQQAAGSAEAARAKQEELRQLSTDTMASNAAAAKQLGGQLSDQLSQINAKGRLFEEGSRRDPMISELAGMRDALAKKYRTDRSNMTEGEAQLLRFMNLENSASSGGIGGATLDPYRIGAQKFLDYITTGGGITDEYSPDTAGVLGNVFSGYDPAKQAELEALKNLTQGTTYGNVGSTAQKYLDKGAYSKDDAYNKIRDYLRGGDMLAGRQIGSNRLG